MALDLSMNKNKIDIVQPPEPKRLRQGPAPPLHTQICKTLHQHGGNGLLNYSYPTQWQPPLASMIRSPILLTPSSVVKMLEKNRQTQLEEERLIQQEHLMQVKRMHDLSNTQLFEDHEKRMALLLAEITDAVNVIKQCSRRTGQFPPNWDKEESDHMTVEQFNLFGSIYNVICNMLEKCVTKFSAVNRYCGTPLLPFARRFQLISNFAERQEVEAYGRDVCKILDLLKSQCSFDVENERGCGNRNGCCCASDYNKRLSTAEQVESSWVSLATLLEKVKKRMFSVICEKAPIHSLPAYLGRKNKKRDRMVEDQEQLDSAEWLELPAITLKSEPPAPMEDEGDSKNRRVATGKRRIFDFKFNDAMDVEDAH